MNKTYRKINSLIESLGSYVPEKKLTSHEISQIIKANNSLNGNTIPLEQISGIKQRRVVSENETSYDLAKRAVEICLDQSKYDPADIEVLISCNISKVNHNNLYQIAPSYSMQLKKEFGLTKAFIFDLNNACAGSFTGIYILDSLIKSGKFSNGLIVSGEYISHLSNTALKEISSPKDDRMACMTLGDAGVACLLEKSSSSDEGFIDKNMFTRNGAKFCIGKPTLYEHGGVIMHTDSSGIFKSNGIGIAQSTSLILKRNNLTFNESIDHVIMHQVSNPGYQLYIDNVNNFVTGEFISDEIMIKNVENFGNTASTSHLLAFDESLKDGKIKENETILFTIQASGVTSGSFFYKMKSSPKEKSEFSKMITKTSESKYSEVPTIMFKDINVSENFSFTPKTVNVIETVISNSNIEEINYLIFTGMLKPGFIAEPAYSTILSEEAKLNNSVNFLAYDITNEGLGWLNACFIIDQKTKNGESNLSLIVTSETDVDETLISKKVEKKIAPLSTATLIGHSTNNSGFSHFKFYYYPEYLEGLKFDLSCSGPNTHLSYYESEEFKVNLIKCIKKSLTVFLEEYKIDLDHFSYILVPQISKTFASNLSKILNSDKVVELEHEYNLYSSSIPCNLHYIGEKCSKHEKVLIIAAGAGIQIGMAIYTF